MNPEWIVVGAILLGAMAAGGANLYVKRRKEAQPSEFENKTQFGLAESDKDEKSS